MWDPPEPRSSRDFGIFSPLNFAPSADSGQKGPQIGLKIGFGAGKKKTDTPMDALNPLDTFWGIFILHHDATKNDLQKGLCFPP
jgi:hypothetical protein